MKTWLNFARLVSVALFAIALTACGTVPSGSPDKDRELKQFKAPQGAARVYIYRDGVYGSLVRLGTFADSGLIGTTAIGTYIYVDLAPGKHMIRSLFPTGHVAVYEEEFMAGTNYFLAQSVFNGGSQLKPVGEDEGKKGVMKSDLAATKD
jgi:hypothetical protein